MTLPGRQEQGEPYRRISVEEALEMQGGGALVVDVRDATEWASGHVRDARHIHVDTLLMEADGQLPKDRDLLFICQAGVRSALACEYVKALGFDQARLYNVEEGTPVWIERSLPTDYGA